MEPKLKGKIELIKDVQTGTSKKGNEWKKVEFTLRIDAEYDDLLCFEIFDVEKVDNFLKYNKVGDTVEVTFNIKCNENNGRHYTTLRAWKIYTVKDETVKEEPQLNGNSVDDKDADDLPF